MKILTPVSVSVGDGKVDIFIDHPPTALIALFFPFRAIFLTKEVSFRLIDPLKISLQRVASHLSLSFILRKR